MSDCRHCKGAGYVIDKAAAVFTCGIVPILAWLTDDGGSKAQNIAYQECGRCEGTGEEP